MKRMVLLYNFTPERIKLVGAVLAPVGCAVRAVKKNEYSVPVGAIAGLERGKSGKDGAINGEMIVICGYSGFGLDVVLDVLRKGGIGRDTLKAILTDSNKDWSGAALYRELLKEREYYNNNALS